jgi:ribosomal protein S18 acetylase RimI-like enzyme
MAPDQSIPLPQPGSELPEIVIRPAHPADAQPAARLIYATGPAYFNWVFGLGDAERAVDIISRLFVRQGNRFSYQFADLVEVSRQVAGLLVSFPGRALLRLNWVTGRHLFPLFSWKDRLQLFQHATPLMNEKESEPGHYLISHLAVFPEWRGKGIGTRLLNYAEMKARSKGILTCTLDVDLNNSPAQRLYRHAGYTVVQTTRYSRRQAEIMGPGVERMVKG